jgi:hypothetical protein
VSLLRVIGFSTLECGCTLGHYREVATTREITYVEAKGPACSSHQHRRNHTLVTERRTSTLPLSAASPRS